MNKLKRFIYMSTPLIALAILLSFFIDLKLTITLLFTVLLIAGYLIYKEKVGQEILIAFMFAAIITSYYMYEYTSTNIMFGRINFFPLLAWTFGLVLLREIYEKVKSKHKFLIMSIVYIIGLFIVEYIGYYLMNIRLSSNFSSFLGIGIIHAQLGMQLFYILVGPVYLAITDYLKVK